jgi:hypothetical protein
LYLVSAAGTTPSGSPSRRGGRVLTRLVRRSLALGFAALLAVAAPVTTSFAASDPVFGVGTGAIAEEGEMLPTGNGRFTIDDRVYSGTTIGRSVASVTADCFTGELRSVEEWALESPRMAGTHESAVTIRSSRGVVSLRLRGQMDQFTASGTWDVVRATGGCSELDGNGRYTAQYSSTRSGPNLKLTFDGEANG